MTKGRLEAFSDGVIAIIITIMVLELRPPADGTFVALWRDSMKGLSVYALSFVFLAIYWNNHHHMMHTVTRVNGSILWANTHLLFWLSLVPFATSWLEESHFAAAGPAVAAYGIMLLLQAVAFTILQTVIIRAHGPDSALARAVGSNAKGRISLFLYAVSIPLAFFVPWVSLAIYITVALIWLVPDKRIERILSD